MGAEGEVAEAEREGAGEGGYGSGRSGNGGSEFHGEEAGDWERGGGGVVEEAELWEELNGHGRKRRRFHGRVG